MSPTDGERTFNLFDAEDQSLAAAEQLLHKTADGPPDIHRDVADLAAAFRRAVREQRRLVKVSDRLQSQLAAVNQELERRRVQAEDALAQLQEAQENLVQSEKLASLGALVGGVAHEINTPVGIALSCASHLADATRDIRKLFEADDIGIDDFRRYMDTASDTTALVLSNCERAASLIRSFKQVAVDRTSSDRRTFQLADYIRETISSLTPQLRQAGHRVQLDCPEDLRLDGYPGVISQILTNFVMNSVVHGYEPGQSGQLTIRVETPDASTLRLIYLDDGKGIPEDLRPRVFDPFFTTRRGAGGTGLGLHVVYNLVTGPLGGQITVDSKPGQGCRFTIIFPR